MQNEHIIRSIPLDEKFPGEVEKLRSEGWQTDPDVPPVVVYHLYRRTLGAGETLPSGLDPLFAAGIKAEMKIDDDKVVVRKPDGRMFKADGSEFKPS